MSESGKLNIFFGLLLFLSFAFYQCGLMKKEQKETTQQKIQSGVSLQVSSLGTLREVAKYTKDVAGNIKASQSELITARLQSGGGTGSRNILTGRILTGRAPAFSMNSPKFHTPLKSHSPRLKSKQQSGCEEGTDENGDYILLTSENFQLYLAVSGSSGIISAYAEKGGFSGSFSNCDQSLSFSCQDVQDVESFVNDVTQFILSHCVIDYVSFYTGVTTCGLSDYDRDKKFDDLSLSFTHCSGSTCSYKEYSCSTNSFSSEYLLGLCADSLESGLQGFAEANCTLVTEGSYEHTDFCTATDVDISIHLGSYDVYIYMFENEDFIGWEKIFFADVCSGSSVAVMERSCDSYVAQNCQFDFSCSFVSEMTGISDPLQILSEIGCSFEKIGWARSVDSNWEICQNYDFTQDGTPDKNYFSGSETYYVSIFVDGGKKTSEKTECEESKCYFYSANCNALDENCQVQENCQWGPTGYAEMTTSGSGTFCSTEDVNDDGKKETIYINSSTVNQFEVVIVRSDGNALKTNCTLSPDFELGECSLKSGSCQTQNICQSISEIDSNCRFDYDFGTCAGEDECIKYLLSFLEEEKGDSYCKKVVDPKTGKFVQIRKVEKGYEYSEGTTQNYFSAVCPSDSKVDFSSCTIDGCEKAIQSAKLALSISGFTDETTRQTFTVKVSDQNSAYGELTIVYYKLSGKAEVSGKLNFPSGEKMQIKGLINEDGSFSFDIALDTAEGTFTGHFDGSADGGIEGKIITPSKDTYTVEIGADGRGKICDKNNMCQDIS